MENSSNFFYNSFNDIRLDRVGNKLLNNIISKGRLIIKNLASNRAEQVQFQRFLWNERVENNGMSITAQEQLNIAASNSKHVLLIQDTTEYSYNHRRNEIQGLGVVQNGKAIGLFSHPMIAVDPEDGFVLGLASSRFWSRDTNKKKKSNYEYDCMNVEDKDSYRWIESALDAKRALPTTKELTIIGDRESDNYSFYSEVPDKRTNILVRAKKKRLVFNNNHKKTVSLIKYMEKIKNFEYRTIKIRQRSINKNSKTNSVTDKFEQTYKTRKERLAKLKICYSKIVIKRPNQSGLKNCPEKIIMNCIYVKEVNNNYLNKKEKLEWILITNLSIENFDDAWKLVDYYKKRWIIEQVFRTSKRGGYRVEDIDCIRADAIEKLCFLALIASIKVMQLTLCRDNSIQKDIKAVFSKEEEIMLKKINPSLEGKTQKQKNPFKAKTVAWAYWIISRLGGWKGYQSEGAAGPITIKNGLDEFYNTIRAYRRLKDVCIT